MSLGMRVKSENLSTVLKNGQCVGCGFCALQLEENCDNQHIDYDWISAVEHWGPVLNKKYTGKSSSSLHICPGHEMNMPQLAESVFGRQPEDPIIGEVRLIASGYAADDIIRSSAASGGVATALIAHLFKTNKIDSCYCTSGKSPNTGTGFLSRNVNDLLQATGSHYHPVAFGSSLSELVNGNDRFVFVGLPCEVAALRQLMSEKQDLAKRCVLVIGLFCGGINRFSGIGNYLLHFGINPKEVDEIDYRDGKWPGQISLSLKNRRGAYKIPRIRGNSRWNILRYMISFQGYWMLPRCRICPDQISDFADIALGDPHLPRFKEMNSAGISAIIARNEKGMSIIKMAEMSGDIVLGQLTRDELVQSQGYTLENRRYTGVYVKVARLLGMKPPSIKVYEELKGAMSIHQYVYAFVDLAKIRLRHVRWLAPLYLSIQIFEYLFLTFSVRLVLTRIKKLILNK